MAAPNSIPYWMYFIVGIVVVVVSYLVDKQTGSDKMTFFVVVGIILIVVGVFKFVYVRMLATKVHKKKKPVLSEGAMYKRVTGAQHAAHPQHKTTAHPQHRTHRPVHHKPATHAVRCPKCNAKLHSSFRHCPGCGAKVR